MSDSLRPHGLQHARLPCPSLTPRACWNSCPLSRWCHPTIPPAVVLFCLQSFPASGSFPTSQFFASGGQSIGVSASASVLPMNIQGLFPWIYVLCQFYLDKIGKKWEISPEEINISSLSLTGCYSAGRHVGRILPRARWLCCSYTPGLFHRGGVNDCPWAMI